MIETQVVTYCKFCGRIYIDSEAIFPCFVCGCEDMAHKELEGEDLEDCIELEERIKTLEGRLKTLKEKRKDYIC